MYISEELNPEYKSIIHYLLEMASLLGSESFQVSVLGYLDTALLYLGVVLLVTVFVRCMSLRYFHPLSVYPGPVLASVTDFWRFATHFAGDTHNVDVLLHKNYGPVVRIGPNTLLFSDYAAYDAIYGFNKAIGKGDFYAGAGDPDPKHASILQLENELAHRDRARKIVSVAFTYTHALSYYPHIFKNTVTLMEQLERASQLSYHNFNIAPYLLRFTFDTMFEITYGESMNLQTAVDGTEIAFSVSHLIDLGFGFGLVPWLNRLVNSPMMLPYARKGTFDKQGRPTRFTKLTAISRSIALGPHVSQLHSSILQNFRQVPETDSKRMDPGEIERETLNYVFAGPGSTAAVLTCIIYYLGLQPLWQSRIFFELKSVEVDSAPNHFLPVLRAIYNETLRLCPPFASVFPRKIGPGAEFAIPGLQDPLPVGTNVGCNPYVLHRSKSMWGDDAEEWNPGRWLDEYGQEKLNPRNLTAFGKGSRACIGKDIAWIVIRTTLIHICKKWEIVAQPGGLKGKNRFMMNYTELMLELKPRQDESQRTV
ncbi:hypothetical protein MMC26_000923 [Xylographa opegraphella]|nr:hypothetical protein [Xylographa opegraphella]